MNVIKSQIHLVRQSLELEDVSARDSIGWRKRESKTKGRSVREREVEG